MTTARNYKEFAEYCRVALDSFFPEAEFVPVKERLQGFGAAFRNGVCGIRFEFELRDHMVFCILGPLINGAMPINDRVSPDYSPTAMLGLDFVLRVRGNRESSYHRANQSVEEQLKILVKQLRDFASDMILKGDFKDYPLFVQEMHDAYERKLELVRQIEAKAKSSSQTPGKGSGPNRKRKST